MSFLEFDFKMRVANKQAQHGHINHTYVTARLTGDAPVARTRIYRGAVCEEVANGEIFIHFICVKVAPLI